MNSLLHNMTGKGENSMSAEDSFFINLGTVTMAHKAKKILTEHSVPSTVGKRALTSAGGCSFGIFVKERKREEVIALLRAYSVKIM